MKLNTFPTKTCLLIIISLALISCKTNMNQNAEKDFIADTSFRAVYSGLFNIGHVGGYRAVLVKNPWDSATYSSKLLFVPRDEESPAIPKGYTVIRIPVRSIAVTSSTAISFLDRLQKLNLLTGVSDADYIFNEAVKLKISKRLVIEIGKGQQLNRERIIESDPDILLASVYQEQQLPDLDGVGAVLVPFADYLEDKPLARAEWIKFAGILTGTEELADSLFRTIEKNYIKLADLAKSSTARPTVFDGNMYDGIWYVSGGNSYMAALYADAGAGYLWRSTPERASIALGFEKVYNQAREADFWRILVNNPKIYDQKMLLAENEKYSLFKAFRQNKVVCCNSFLTPYYEEGVTQPDIILADLISCFHPELLPGHEQVYYQFLK
jgi:iron complex transport system substrate-binding protein